MVISFGYISLYKKCQYETAPYLKNPFLVSCRALEILSPIFTMWKE